MLGWLFPLGLAGLAALALPLLLHLARRREQRVLRFAAMRWLPPGRAPRRKLRLQERALLLLRLALLATAALWLAQPILHDAGNPRRWLAVSPEVDPAAAIRIAADFDSVVWVTPDFPDLDPTKANARTDTHPRDAAATDWLHALSEFTARLPARDTATVLVPSVITSTADELPSLWHPVEWREAPAAERPQTLRQQPLLALRYTDEAAPTLHLLRSAIAAWSEAPHLHVHLDQAPATTPVPPTADAILWTGPLPDPKTLPNVPLLHIPANPPSPPGRGAGGEGPPPPGAPPTPNTPEAATTLPEVANLSTIGDNPSPQHSSAPLPTHPLTPETRWRALSTPLHPSTLPALYQPDFPHRLHATLFGQPHPTRIPATLLTTLPVTKQEPTTASTALSPRGLRDLPLSPPLLWLLLALFLLERWLASGRRLDRAP